MTFYEQIAKSKDCRRLVWEVHDKNTKALDLYKRVGGKCERQWWNMKMYKPELEKFAS
jgi:hypothetical protein